MERKIIEKINLPLPRALEEFVRGARIYDSSCSPEARVFYIEKDEGYFLKKHDTGALKAEAEMTEYLHGKGLSAEVIDYISDSCDWLLTRRIAGEDCTHADYLADPTRLCDKLAEALRILHDTDFSDCPVKDRVTQYLATARDNCQNGRYDTSHFPDSFGYSSAEQAYAVLEKHGDALKSEVLIHGDYCLPNIILDNWNFSGFIDVGYGGVGDRHIDLFWGAWTLWFNLKTDKYRDRFLDAYGRDKINVELLRVVAAAEVFG